MDRRSFFRAEDSPEHADLEYAYWSLWRARMIDWKALEEYMRDQHLTQMQWHAILWRCKLNWSVKESGNRTFAADAKARRREGVLKRANI